MGIKQEIFAVVLTLAIFILTIFAASNQWNLPVLAWILIFVILISSFVGIRQIINHVKNQNPVSDIETIIAEESEELTDEEIKENLK